ncbi:DsbE family thiol:disulfide interchange protein [uncultured Leclercia sp.]|uniref:DsbE family thiol:disulfide interchange protein n=1 Tax=uncultured Leclercia sp. TaxID=332959 RepID=UPI002598181B|nr:DsbE family thiol:disulfide interchange protein [uncultured Leclercia sp.]
MRKILLLPFVAFVLLAGLLFWQLQRNAGGDNPHDLASALIGKPLPAFPLNELRHPGRWRQGQDLARGKPMLLNVWATWCPTCQAEHAFLNTLASAGVRLVGIDYKDDRHKALRWLQASGDPYSLNLSDADGQAGLELGVYGAPETFLIDSKGIVRFRHTGALTPEVWRDEIQPLWDRVSREAGS